MNAPTGWPNPLLLLLPHTCALEVRARSVKISSARKMHRHGPMYED